MQGPRPYPPRRRSNYPRLANALGVGAALLFLGCLATLIVGFTIWMLLVLFG